MKINFFKYQGTGNDFVMIDNRKMLFPKDSIETIKKITDRKFGIGADGLILIENHPSLDFEMVYYNADGSQSLCGNGSRCAVAFAKKLKIIKNETHFQTIDGEHFAFIKNNIVHFQLRNIPFDAVKKNNNDFFINNGSPHHIVFVENSKKIDVYKQGKKIRYSDTYQPHGTNVNFVELAKNHIKVRTYERGVENETLSCGTGVTASSLVSYFKGLRSPINIETLGGKLSVSFDLENNVFTNIFLSGGAEFIFKGEIKI